MSPIYSTFDNKLPLILLLKQNLCL